MPGAQFPKKYWWVVLVVVPIVVPLFGVIQKLVSNNNNAPHATLIPPYSSEKRITEQHSWKLFEAWMRNHPEILRQYGSPKEVKFVSLHEQNFTKGYVAYNVTHGWSVWLNTQTSEFLRLGTPVRHLTPGSGRTIDETVFADVTAGLNDEERKLYRSLVEARVLSPDFKGVGLIGGIGTLYIQRRLYKSFGRPSENEFFVVDAVHGVADGYEVLVGLRHSVGLTTPDSPKSAYVLYRDGRFERHVQFPQPHQ